MNARALAAALGSLAVAACLAAGARAQAWSGAGAPVCTAWGPQSNVRAVADGAGGAYVGWSDKRGGAIAYDVYLARIGPDGAPVAGWPLDGLPVCTATGAQVLSSMAPDGSGGVYLAWEDQRDDVQYDVFGQHVLADGTLAAGWPVDGLGIADWLGEQRDPELLADGTGGVFAVWSDARTDAFSGRDVYAQHLLAGGTPAAGWAVGGMRVTNARTWDYASTLALDGAGGIYVTWNRDLTGGGQDVGAQHLGADGLPAATWPDTGIVLCGQPLDQGGAALASAPGGTAIAVWKDQRHWTSTDPEFDFYALRFGPDTSRAAGWPHDGVPLYATRNGVSAPFGASDGAGGLLFMWGELVGPTDEDLFVVHVDANGTVVTSVDFPDGVVSLCPDPAYQHPVTLVADGAGGAYAGFQDYRIGLTNPDAYVQHVLAGAAIAPGWAATGVDAGGGPAPEGATIPVAVPGGVIAAWTRGVGDTADVYASMIGDDGVVPTLVSLVSSAASPDRVRVAWQVGGTGEWRIERRDGEAAAWREVARERPDGLGRIAVDDANVVAGGRYGYRLSPASGGAALGETWLDVPLDTGSFAILGIWPNPVRSGAQVKFAVPAVGPVTLAIVDVQGRMAKEWRSDGEAGERTTTFPGLNLLRPGLYWLRLEQDGRVTAARVAVLD